MAPRARDHDDSRAAALASEVRPLAERPRERLWADGVGRASDRDLVTLVLGAGTRGRPVGAVADGLLASAGGLVALSRAAPGELAQAPGVGAARAAQLVAAFELGRRAVGAAGARPLVLRQAADVFARVRARLAGVPQELFLALAVDARNGLIDEVEVARGHLTSVEVHPREVFRPLIRAAAAAAVVVHNHPSGDPTPSSEDLVLTRRLRAVGELVGIPILDHVIVAGDQFRSIAEWMGTEF